MSEGPLIVPCDSGLPTPQRIAQLKGRQPTVNALAEIRALIGAPPADGHRRDLLIEHLHRLNDHFRALFERHLLALAHDMQLPVVEVYEVASFYHHFLLLSDEQTAPMQTLRVCDGLSCQLAGGGELLADLSAKLVGHQVRVMAAPCVGRCEQAPVAVLQQYPLPQASVDSIISRLNDAVAIHPSSSDAANFVASDWAGKSLPVPTELAPDYTGYASYCAHGGYVLPAALANGTQTTESILQTLEQAGMRGLGGAGFPTGRKWRVVRSQAAPRVLVANLDEGEPGTFKDRTYLERDPHRFLEGLLIAAQVVGIDHCYIYLRDEYHGCRALLQRELAQLQADPPCPLPSIELRRGAGAYICGEESALIESLEGKRGQPRLRPPYVAEVGLAGRPTLAHNFETLYWVRDLVEQGADWFKAFGRNGRSGLRSFSVSGRVRQPGVKLAPAGISVQELIDEYCGGMADGHQLYAYLPGGASGGILPAALNQLPLDFDTLQPYGCFIGSGAVVVLSQQDRARDAALNAMRFFANESCGQCTPCRVGTAKAATLMQARQWDQALLQDLSQLMTYASICGLGQAAPNALRCVQNYFAHEVA